MLLKKSQVSETDDTSPFPYVTPNSVSLAN